MADTLQVLYEMQDRVRLLIEEFRETF